MYMNRKQEYIPLATEIVNLCTLYRKYWIEAEKHEDALWIKDKVKEMWKMTKSHISIENPDLLIILMDAYEVTRDEGMLQEVLDVVSGELERLEVSAESVKLLAYCYYYVEEKECAVRAREMLEELRQKGVDVTETEKVLEELT